MPAIYGHHSSVDTPEPEKMDHGGGKIRDFHRIDDQRIGRTSNGAVAGNIF